ncbi:cobyrinate a,c-diamide synthase [Parasynechococcus sp.]|uniref:cobyrinate a,c-diamide synthase n=1 Tax=Parasynechococcus sp. TaxID=3101203 RepID=UPI0037043F69
MAVVITAPASGSGKTLVSLALLAWARQQGHSIQGFKVGPDYLDPQLITAVSGQPCRNLDICLCGESWVERAFHGYGGGNDFALVEGVMGLFDGVGNSEEGSTAAVARQLGLPVVLVVDAGGQAASLAALVRGFRDHDPDLTLAGVILNRVSTDRHRQLLEDVLERIQVPVLGCLPRCDALALPSRHLGLAPAHELGQADLRIRRWADLAAEHLNLKALLPLLRAPEMGEDPLKHIEPDHHKRPDRPVAVAGDAAFHFRYPETGELLERLGMPLLPWSPLANEAIPNEACGLILPGGFPEQHAEELSTCRTSLKSLRDFSTQRPTYAECGGMLLLGRQLSDLNGRPHAMAGLLDFSARRGRLQVGYRTLRPLRDGLLTRRGDQLQGHEFHRWELDTAPQNPDTSLWEIEGWRSQGRAEGWTHPKLHASWVHLHWASCSTICSRWDDALGTGNPATTNAL